MAVTRPSIELLSIGEELLIGRISNTNAQYLARRIASLGGRVTRITTIGDDIDEIALEIKAGLARAPRLILTTGGLGPTFDDKTLEGIAKGLDRKTALDEEALDMLKKRYAELAAARHQVYEMTPARLKMAMLPEGSSALRNPAGSAPGVIVRVNDVSVVALPGVPAEMEAIFETGLADMIRGWSNAFFAEGSFRVEGIGESDLAPSIDAAMRENPSVYVKSHPRGQAGGFYVILHLTTSSDTVEKAQEAVHKTADKLKELVTAKGGSFTSSADS